MIKSISIQGYKSFARERATSVTFDATKRVALFYGVNGAGKSAIGQVIHHNGNNTNPIANCSLTLTRDEPYQYLVYNEEFIDETFRNRTNMPGIFTIGKPEAAALEQAERLEQQVNQWRDDIERLNEQMKQREAEASRAYTAVLDGVWPAYTTHKTGAMKEWLEGYGNAKRKLFEELNGISFDANVVPPTIEALTTRMQDVADKTATARSEWSLDLTEFESLESNALWGQAILGSGDSSLAAQIQALGNMDWVRQGKPYVEHSTSCPFCQQDLPHDFSTQLARLFDTSYENRIAEINRLVEDYQSEMTRLSDTMDQLLADEPFAKDHPALSRTWAELNLMLSANIGLIEKKQQSPGEVVALQASKDARQAVLDAVTQLNERIRQFNTRIADRDNERTRIKKGFWLRLRHDYEGVLSVYKASKTSTDSALATIATEVNGLRQNLLAAEGQLVQLRASTTGTDKAIEAINGRLASLGIDAFKIKKEGTGHLYHLERRDGGVDDYRSLSEGEKTLITFLYFVELINGSAVADNTIPLNRKIVVIDDPISSLSHNYVYDIASIIVHDIIALKDDEGHQLKQIIILTHSLFFHHELVSAHGKAKQLDFKRVLKHSHTVVVPMNSDELLNDYEAYWQVVRDAKEGNATRIMLANAMRCICERFFYFTRRQDDFKAALKRISEQEHRFTPLARYLDRQSHADGVNHTDFGDYDMGYYLEKFRLVFQETDQMAHYTAMLREEVVPGEGTADAA